MLVSQIVDSHTHFFTATKIVFDYVLVSKMIKMVECASLSPSVSTRFNMQSVNSQFNDST